MWWYWDTISSEHAATKYTVHQKIIYMIRNRFITENKYIFAVKHIRGIFVWKSA